jgi:3-hydroxybutyryl-CoA dehydrogenase
MSAQPSMSPVRTIGICGAGQMGAAAAVCARRAGYRTLLWIRDARKIDAVNGSLDRLTSWMQTHVGGAVSSQGSVAVVTDLAVVDRDADVVLECIAESMDAKADLFGRLAGARDRGAIFLTTTSGLSITELGRRTAAGSRLVGTHFWNPPHLMPLVEVIRGEETQDEVVDCVVGLIRALGKIPVRVNRDVPGFVGNRLLHAMWREAIFLVQSGIATAEDVDRVARLTFGLRMPAVGPLENMDLVGLDLVETIHEYLLADLSASKGPLALLRQHVDSGELGMKTGQGFHDWRVRDGQQVIEHRDQQIVHQLKFLRELEIL